MEIIENLLTDEETDILSNAPIRYAEWIIQTIQTNPIQPKENRELIFRTRQMWWKQRNWEAFAKLYSETASRSRQQRQPNNRSEWFQRKSTWQLVLTEIRSRSQLNANNLVVWIADFLSSQITDWKITIAYSSSVNYQIPLLAAVQKSNNPGALAKAYYNFADDQYYDSVSDEFYKDLNLDRLEEVWQLFREATQLEPFNFEIREALIGLMHQSQTYKVDELLHEVKEMLLIDPKVAKTFEKDPIRLHNYARHIWIKLQHGWEINDSDIAFTVDIIQGKYETMPEKVFGLSNYANQSLDSLADSSKLNAQELFDQAVDLLAKGALLSGVKLIKKAIALNPENPEFHSILGKVCLEMFCLKEAIEEYTESIRLAPRSGKYHLGLGNVYLLGEEFENARVQFNIALDLNPYLEEARYGIKQASAS